MIRHLICGSVVGTLGIVPAAGSAWALEGDPPPAYQQLGASQEAYGTDVRAVGSNALDGELWEPAPQGEEFDPEPQEELWEEEDPGTHTAISDTGSEVEAVPWADGPLEGAPRAWVRPVTDARVSAPYGIPGDWIAGHHTGIDLAVPVGTPIRAVGKGVVSKAGRGGDYGLMVLMRMDDRRYTLFAHLSKVLVKPGKRVKTGTLIGYSGNSGRTTGPHLHFEVRETARYGSDIDPVAYLASKGVRL
jgi:murein DD-endopeptidase MepM/ murein hydrolase activator NlpD